MVQCQRIWTCLFISTPQRRLTKLHNFISQAGFSFWNLLSMKHTWEIPHDHPPLSWPVRTPVNHRPPTRDGTRAFPGAGASHPFKRRAFKANIKTARRLKNAPFTCLPYGARPSSGSRIFCVAAVYSGSSGGVRLAGYKFWRRSVAVKQRPPCLCVRVCCGDGVTCACARGWEMKKWAGLRDEGWLRATVHCYMTTRRNVRRNALFFWVFFKISFSDFIVQWCVQVIATKLNE